MWIPVPFQGKIIRTILEQYYSTVLTDELRVKVADTLINQSNLDSLVSEYVPELEGELNFIQETMTAGNDDFYEVDLTEFQQPTFTKLLPTFWELRRVRILPRHIMMEN